MSSVERLIFDVLAHRGSVQLPGVGTLDVRRRKAKRVSDTRIIPPAGVVVFSPEGSSAAADRAFSVVDMLNQREGLSMDDAWATYNAWAEGVSQDGAFVIDGVGTVRDGRFEPSEEMHEALNPAGSSDEYGLGSSSRGGGGRRRCRCGMAWWAWVLIALGAFVLWFCGMLCFNEDARQAFLDGWSSTRRGAEVAVPAAMPEPVVDTVAVAVAAPVPPVGGVAGRFYVIAGAFAEPGNADKYMAELRRTHPALTTEKLVQPRTGYELVSIFSSADRSEAFRTMDRHWDVSVCLWVFEAR